MRILNTRRQTYVMLPLLMAVAFSVGASTKEATIKHNPEITIQPRTLDQRVCLYDGRDYSLGAVMIVDSIVLECKPENDFESNGCLKWHKVGKQEQ